MKGSKAFILFFRNCSNLFKQLQNKHRGAGVLPNMSVVGVFLHYQSSVASLR